MRENTKHCRYLQQWRFEKMGKFLLKLHRSAKSLDPHHVCEQTLFTTVKVFITETEGCELYDP
jgi:hypothetical protein